MTNGKSNGKSIWDLDKIRKILEMMPESLKGGAALLVILLTFLVVVVVVPGEIPPLVKGIVIIAVVLLLLVVGGVTILIYWLRSKPAAALTRPGLSVGDQAILGKLLDLEMGAIAGHKTGYISSHIHAVLPSVTRNKLLFFLRRVL